MSGRDDEIPWDAIERTEARAQEFDDMRKLYDEYVENARRCDTYEGALKWIERAAAVSAEMFELKYGPLSISAK